MLFVKYGMLIGVSALAFVEPLNTAVLGSSKRYRGFSVGASELKETICASLSVLSVTVISPAMTDAWNASQVQR